MLKVVLFNRVLKQIFILYKEILEGKVREIEDVYERF